MGVGTYHHSAHLCDAVDPCSNVWYVTSLPLIPSSTILTVGVGESEYWFALIKVLLVIVFIIVGLIYDWGGVHGHPGPVTVFQC